MPSLNTCLQNASVLTPISLSSVKTACNSRNTTKIFCLKNKQILQFFFNVKKKYYLLKRKIILIDILLKIRTQLVNPLQQSLGNQVQHRRQNSPKLIPQNLAGPRNTRSNFPGKIPLLLQHVFLERVVMQQSPRLDVLQVICEDFQQAVVESVHVFLVSLFRFVGSY